MGTSTGSATNNMPRITDKWGKYAKKDSGTNTTTTVSTSGTTVTTNAKKVTVNVFNGQPQPPKPGNVIYKGRPYNVPKNIWGSPYTLGGGLNMPMGNIWGNGFNFGNCCSGSGNKLDNWDRFYQFANGPISGPVFGAAALGGLGGLAMGIGKALMGDDKKSDKSDDSSKIKSYYNGTSGTSGTSGASGTSNSSSSGSSSTGSASNTKKYDEIKDNEYKDLPQVKDYNSSLSGLTSKQTAVKDAKTKVVTLNSEKQGTAKALREHEVKVSGLKDAMGRADEALKAAIEKAKKDNPNITEEELKNAVKSEQATYDKAKKDYEDAVADTKAKDADDAKQKELEAAEELVGPAEEALRAETEKVDELKREAERAISYIKNKSDTRTTYEKWMPNCMGGKPSFEGIG